jgi:hypothetical protein
MENETNNEEKATLLPTKAGRGFKIAIDGRFFYAGKQNVLDMVNGKRKSATFSTITDEIAAA